MPGYASPPAEGRLVPHPKPLLRSIPLGVRRAGSTAQTAVRTVGNSSTAPLPTLRAFSGAALTRARALRPTTGSAQTPPTTTAHASGRARASPIPEPMIVSAPSTTSATARDEYPRSTRTRGRSLKPPEAAASRPSNRRRTPIRRSPTRQEHHRVPTDQHERHTALTEPTPEPGL